MAVDVAMLAGAGVQPNLISYNLAIRACAGQPGSKLRAAQLDQAFQLLADMRAAGITPDVFTVTSLLGLCAQAGQGRRALALYEVRPASSACMRVHMSGGTMQGFRGGQVRDRRRTLSSSCCTLLGLKVARDTGPSVCALCSSSPGKHPEGHAASGRRCGCMCMRRRYWIWACAWMWLFSAGLLLPWAQRAWHRRRSPYSAPWYAPRWCFSSCQPHSCCLRHTIHIKDQFDAPPGTHLPSLLPMHRIAVADLVGDWRSSRARARAGWQSWGEFY